MIEPKTHRTGKDKLYHVIACLVIALFETEAAIACALTKEGADNLNYGHWCWWDIAYDMLGVLIGTMIRLLLTKLVYGYACWRWY